MKLSFPKWENLPQLDLYLDQVLSYVNQTILAATDQPQVTLTASMVNNYVKHGYIPKPIKKKYNSLQVARLLAITSLKPVFSIQDIWTAIEKLELPPEQLYNSFVSAMNEENADIPELILSACHTLKTYYQTRQLLSQLESEVSHESNS